MKPVSVSQMQKVQRLQADAMGDLCNIYRVSLSSGTYGNLTETRTAAYTNLPCGIDFTNGQIKQSGQVMLVDYDAVLRVADGVVILMTDEIDLVEKGEFIISGTFKPYSAPVVNSSVQKVTLKRQAP